MKNFTKVALLTTLFLLTLLVLNHTASAAPLAAKMRGKILLQVEEHGEAWYVNPKNDQRYYLGRPTDAFNIMRTLGVGISEETYAQFLAKGAKALSGQIVLRVLAKGEAYYIHPGTYQLHYLGRPADAFEIMRKFGLGISNSNLALITTATTPSSTASNANETTPTTKTNNSTKKAWELATNFTTPYWNAPTHHCGNGVCEATAYNSEGILEYEDTFWCPLDCPTPGYSTYKQGQFYSIAKPEFEYLAKTILNDMQYCHVLIKDYLGLEFKNNPTVYLITATDTGIQFAQSGNGGNTYIYLNPESALTQENLEIKTGVADNFWVKSGPAYCSNAHERVHAFPQLSIDRWWGEGLAEYFTRKNHNNFSGNECQTTGYYGPDYFLNEKKFFPYLNLSNFCFSYADPQMNDSCYETSTCMIKYLEDTYGDGVIKKIMTTFKSYDSANPATPGQVHSIAEFIDHGIVPVTGEGVRAVLLSRFGLK